MRRLKLLMILTGLVLCIFGSIVPAKEKEDRQKVRALIVTGQDYPGHKWRLTTPALREALTADLRFEVHVVENPHFLDSSALDGYDLVVLHFMNWKQPPPGERACTNLKKFVEGGKGLFIVHFACGAFQDWPEFSQLAGRVWDPNLRGHDKFGPFTVEIANDSHPITRGLKDFETRDELYTCLAGEKEVEVLATARSKVDGKDYMMAFSFTYGKGRVFHSPLGHDADAIRNSAVSELFRRGAAWAVGLSPNAQTPKTEPYVPETPSWPKNPPDNWPTYHLAHPTWSEGSPFDPNPALFYKGRYHLHYIYRNKTGFVFAHVSSKDMVHWKWHPTVLAPPTTGHGMFSGTGFFTKDGQPAIVYHGQGSNRNWIQYAMDDGLNKWTKPQVMLPRGKDGKFIENVPYFDPDIWRNGETFYGVNGVSSKKPPQIMKSDNLKDWTYIGELLHPDFDEKKLGVKKSEDISCPNMFKLGDKWVLVCISHRLGCRYFIGDFKDERFLPEYHALLGGNSRRYFAPESLLTPDGRRVNWTWFHGGHVKGIQSLPTELELPSDGILRMRPIKELKSLRYDKQTSKKVTVKKDVPMMLEKIKGQHLELKMVVKKPGEHNFGADVLCDEQGQAGLRINVNRENNLLEAGSEKAPFVLNKGEALTLRIFVDTTLVEVFANERQIIMTDKPRDADAKINDGVALFSEGQDIQIDKITAWKMKSAYAGD